MINIGNHFRRTALLLAAILFITGCFGAVLAENETEGEDEMPWGDLLAYIAALEERNSHL